MYKKMLPLLLLAGSATLSYAQTTLTGTNFNMVTTDAFALKICDPAIIDTGVSGANVSWDYHTLVATSTDTGKVKACAATPNCALFPGSTIALTGPGVTRATNYYSEDASSLVLRGYYSAADTTLILSDPATQFTYPFNYGTHFSDTYAGILTLGTLSAHQTGTISVTCTGWGRLILPSRTDTGVLKVHTTETFRDSTFVFGAPVVLNYVIETIAWYKPNYHSALLTINTVTQVGNSTPSYTFVAYAPTQLAGVNDLPNSLGSLNLYPNPVTDELNIDLNTKSAEQIHISLMDITGRQVAVLADNKSNGAQHIKYNTSGLTKGLYMVRVQAGSETTTRKVQIQ
jgi:hypothetical protein